MPYSFGDCWRLAALHAPVPDPLLHRQWTQWAYNQFCDRRGWSHLRGETNISVTDQKSGTCGVTIGSATVTPSGMVFAATDVGRAFKVGSIPVYTIIGYTAGPGTVTLNRNYSEATNAAAVGNVLDAYVTMPEDFHRFISVLDPVNRWRLRFWVSQDLLNKWDPSRQSSGTARLLADLDYSPVPAAAGQPRYELYPYQTTARTYPVTYFVKSAILGDDTPIIGPLSRRAPEILLNGALSRCARWPGTESRKNPYFNLALANELEKAFDKAVMEVTVTDQELYFDGLPMSDFMFADFPWDSNWLQSHEPYVIG